MAFPIKSLSAQGSSDAPSFSDTTALQEGDSSSNRAQLLQQALDPTDPGRQNENLHQLFTDWTINSPRDAARCVQGMPPGIPRDQALRIVAQTWGGKGPDEALKWSLSLPNESERTMFLTNVCLGLAQRNPAAAVRIACQNHDDESGLLENLTQQWAEKETPAALAWATQLEPSEARDQLLQRIAFVESKTNPAEAANLVVQQMQPGPAQMEAALTVVHQWGERDWNSAAAWVNRFPEGPVRDRAITELNGIAQD